MSTQQRIAGRALDAEVAERVMGWSPFPYLIHAGGRGGDGIELRDGLTVHHCPPGRVHISTVAHVPEFSTDIAAAFQVVEAMRAKGYRWRIGSGDENPDHAFAAFWLPRGFNVQHSAEAATPALAICLAALAMLDDPEANPSPSPSQSASENSPAAPAAPFPIPQENKQ